MWSALFSSCFFCLFSSDFLFSTGLGDLDLSDFGDLLLSDEAGDLLLSEEAGDLLLSEAADLPELEALFDLSELFSDLEIDLSEVDDFFEELFDLSEDDDFLDEAEDADLPLFMAFTFKSLSN